MKSRLIIALSLFITSLSFAQAPESVNYQAIIRDGNADILSNKNISLLFSIHSGSANGTAVFVEKHKLQTNEFGLVNLQIGNGIDSLGDFSTINWASNEYWLQVNIDENAGDNYSLLGSSKLVSVPYALHAKTAERLTSGGSGALFAGEFVSISNDTINNTAPGYWNESGGNINYNAGNVGIGTTNPGASLDLTGSFKYNDGNQQQGYVLTSDPNGNASWQSNGVAASFIAGKGINISNDTISSTADTFWRYNGLARYANTKNSYASGNYALAYGEQDTAIGNYNVILGFDNYVEGVYSYSVGYSNTIRDGDGALALGHNNISNGQGAIGIGSGNHIFGTNTIAIGKDNVVDTANYCLLIGRNNIARENFSLAIGRDNEIQGQGAMAMGRGLRAPSHSEMAVGLYNVDYTPTGYFGAYPEDRIFSVGNGISTTNRSNAMTILKSGNTGIGVLVPNARLHVVDDFTNNGQYVANIQNTANGAWANGIQIRAGQNTQTVNNRFISFVRPDGTEIGAVSQTTSTGVDYNTTSDARLKTNIQPSSKGLRDLMLIEVKDYVYKDDLNKSQTGFVAQQVYEHYPNAVTPGGDNAKTNPWMMDYGKMTPLLVKAIQDQQEIIEQLTKRIEELESSQSKN